MLNHLRIANLAALDKTEMELGPGLTAITGETGAGKTMILTGLRLLTGLRADARIVANGATRTEIDAVVTPGSQVAAALEEGGFIVEDGEATFSRTVYREGRSRASISGRPVPAKRLAETLGEQITIHGQADQWRLRSPSEQRRLLDGYGGPEHESIVSAYRDAWVRLARLERALAEVEEGRDQREIELRYLSEAAAEIESLALRPNEEEILEADMDRLTNVAALKEASSAAVSVLDGDMGAADRMADAANLLMQSHSESEDLGNFITRARSLEAEIRALNSDIREYGDSLFEDPDLLSQLHERRAALTDVMRGRAVNVQELLDWLAESKRRIAQLAEQSADPQVLQEELEEARRHLSEAGHNLTHSRRSVAARLERAVTKELRHLALKDARFIVSLEETAPNQHGYETVSMRLRPHEGAAPVSLGSGVSGGELSRIMLALELVQNEDASDQTMVFDEVDAGIGGKTANFLASRLKRLSQRSQVLVVTHLPQVAALADRNFVITKKEGTAQVTQVTGELQVSELVRMLGGDAKDEATRHVARAMREPQIVED